MMVTEVFMCTIRKAEDIKISKLNSGDKLYHYTSAEGLMGISNGEIWITEKSFLNDSTEFRIANEVLKYRIMIRR